MGRKLGNIRKNLYKRYTSVEKKVVHATLPDLLVDQIEKRVFGFLTQLGLDYPMGFTTPPPDVEVVAHQGTKCLDPYGYTQTGSPSVPTDVACITFRARKGGFLVVDLLDIIMEDPISEEFFTIDWTFDSQKNTPNRQCTKSNNEPGHWKFNRVTLVDGECLTVCVRNPNQYAGGCFSFESSMWTL